MKKIIIFGYSLLALEVLKRLHCSDSQLLFCSQDEHDVKLVADQGFAAKVVDVQEDEDLIAIGIGSSANILFCFFPTDSDNVFLTIAARALAPQLIIIAVVEDPESAEKLIAAGANKIIDPYEICGRKTHEMLTRPEISRILDHTVFGQQDLKLAQIELPKDCYLENTAMSRLNLNEKFNLILIGVVDSNHTDELHFAISDQDYYLGAGDFLVVLGITVDIEHFKAYLH